MSSAGQPKQLSRRELLRTGALTTAALAVGCIGTVGGIDIVAPKEIDGDTDAGADDGSVPGADGGPDPDAGAENRAPVWSPLLTEIVIFIGMTYDLNSICSDPDGNALTYSLDPSSLALPAGVTLDATTGILTASDSAAEGSSSGLVFVADDGA